MNIVGLTLSSSHVVDGRVWRVILSLKVPSKIKIFLRKISENALPTFVNLFGRKCCQSPICRICHNEDETVEHLILGCEWVWGVWFVAGNELRIVEEIISFDR